MATGTAAWTMSPQSLDFGYIVVGKSSTQSVTITSSGTAALTVSSASVSGTGYSLSGSTLPVTLQPNQTLTLNVKFAPTSWGSKSGTLTVNSSSATNYTASVSLSGMGTGTAQWKMSPKSLAFGNVATGQSSTKSVTITSSGTSPITVSSASVSGTGYTVSGATFPVTLNPNATLTLNVKFAPTTTGSATGTLTVKSSAATKFTANASLSGTGTGTVGLTTSPSSLSFGDVTVGSSATLSETLTSSGTSTVTVNSAGVSGTGYTVSGATFPVTLSPSQKVTLNVKYAPTKGGATTGTLTISSSSSSNPTTTVGLSGTGTHAVTLSWQAPSGSSMPVTGYNVYRATGSSSSYTLLSSTASSQLSFFDTNVQSGTAYSYYVESVDSSGTQSSPSNKISLTVPTP